MRHQLSLGRQQHWQIANQVLSRNTAFANHQSLALDEAIGKRQLQTRIPPYQLIYHTNDCTPVLRTVDPTSLRAPLSISRSTHQKLYQIPQHEIRSFC